MATFDQCQISRFDRFSMKYHRLSQRDTQALPAEAAEKEYSYLPVGRISVSIATLLALSSTTLLLLLLLLALSIFRADPHCSVKDHGFNVTRPYGRANMSRMSLNHEHDDLWNVFEPRPSFGGM